MNQYNTEPVDDTPLSALVHEWHTEVSERMRDDEERARQLKGRIQATGGDIEHDPTLNYLAGKIEGAAFALNALAVRMQADRLDPAQFLDTGDDA